MQNLDGVTHWFRHVGEIIVKVRWFVIGILIAFNVFAYIGIQQIPVDVSDESWFMKDDPIMVASEQFEDVFGNDDYVAVLVEADDVFAPEILRMIRELSQELEENVPYADEVVSLTDVEFTRGTEEGIEIGQIVPESIPTTPEEREQIRQVAFSKEFLVNRLFSDDSRQAWIFLRIQEYPKDDDTVQRQVGKAAIDIVSQEKYSPYTLKLSGSPVAEYEETLFFAGEAKRLLLLAAGVGVFVLAVALHSVSGLIVPLVTAFSSILWVFGAMGYLGIAVDTTVITLPIYLGLAVSIGYSIHIFNFFRQQFNATGQRKSSVVYAVQETGWPILFTVITTLAALLSFYVVPVRQIRWMGLSAAAVIFSTYLIVMTLTPVALSVGSNKAVNASASPLQFLHDWLDRGFLRLSRWILCHTKPIIVIFLILIVFFLIGFTRIYVSMHYTQTFGVKIPFMSRLDYIARSKIGSMNSYDITLTYDEPGRVKDPEILKNLDLLISEIKAFSLVKRVSSLLDILKDINQVMNSDDPEYYCIPDDRGLIAQYLLLYEMANGSEQENWADYEYSTLRLQVEISDLDTAQIEQQFRHLKQRAQELFPDAQFAMLGRAVQTSVAQHYIAWGEIVSFLIALVVIGILMMIVFQSIKIGLIGMIPNLAPVLIVGGLMGYLYIPLEMTTMMIIPLLLGLAVDDTIHFITHSKLEFQRTGSYEKSIEITFRTVGKAIFMTSFILIAMFAAYMTSVARFFVNLGILATAGILAALLADYFITPLLVNWLRPFEKRF